MKTVSKDEDLNQSGTDNNDPKFPKCVRKIALLKSNWDYKVFGNLEQNNQLIYLFTFAYNYNLQVYMTIQE